MKRILFIGSVVISLSSSLAFADKLTKRNATATLIWGCKGCPTDADRVPYHDISLNKSCFDRGVPKKCEALELVLIGDSPLVVTPVGGAHCTYEHTTTVSSPSYPFELKGYVIKLIGETGHCVIDASSRRPEQPFRIYLRN